MTCPPSKPDAEFLQRRLDTIRDGIRDAIRREVRRLRECGLPVYVYRDGRVIALSDAPSDDGADTPSPEAK